MHGVTIHAHIAAQMVDGRSIGQLETNSLALRLALAGLAALGFLVGWGLPDETARPAGERRGQRRHHRRGHNCVLAVPYHTAAGAGAGGVVPGRVLRALPRQVVRAARRSIDVVREMKSMSLFRCVMALAAILVAGAASASPAAAQIYVMELTAAAIRVGSALDMGATISIPAGSHIRAVLPSGKTQTIKGPYDRDGGRSRQGPAHQRGRDGLASRTSCKTGGSTEATHGRHAQRRAPAREHPAWPSPGPPFPVADGTVCVEKGAKLRLVRSRPPLRSA